MPNIKSAEKRVLVNGKNAIRNRAARKAYKEAVKAFEVAVSEKAANVEELYKVAVSNIDKAWTKGILARNTASRKKARLAKLLSK